VGTRSSPGVNQLDHGADNPLPSSTKVTNGLELYLYLPSVPALVFHGVTFPLNITITGLSWKLYRYAVMKTDKVIRKTLLKKDCKSFPENRGRGGHAKVDTTCVKHYLNINIY
jgi:hypothetical protein